MSGNKCPLCNQPLLKKFVFCPYCGCNIKAELERREYGILGRGDNIQESFGFNSFNINMKDIFSTVNSLMNEMTKEFGSSKPFNGGFKIKISDGRSLGNKTQNKKPSKKLPSFTEDKIKKFVNFPKKEPTTEVRRLSNRIIYEVSLPGVKSMSDIMMNKLENSIEIKAVGKNISWSKLIPLGQMINYKLLKEKLILEFKI